MVSTLPWIQLATLILTILLAVMGFRKALERDQEANWQRAKTELYGDFLNSFMSFAINTSNDNKNQIKIACLDKLNRMTLFSNKETLSLCYSIIDDLGKVVDQNDYNQCMERIRELISLMREEIIPNRHKRTRQDNFKPRLFFAQTERNMPQDEFAGTETKLGHVPSNSA